MYDEDYYAAESKARDILAAEGIDFGEEMSAELEARLHALTLSLL